MRRGTKTHRILLSFVGTNDVDKTSGRPGGLILTILKKRKFDEVHLLWNYSEVKNLSDEEMAKHVRDQVLSRGYCNTVKLHRVDCSDVTDHNEIYPKLLAVCQSLKPSPGRRFTAAIASGTPAMQVCWILLAESGDFPVELKRGNEPWVGRQPVAPIRLSSSLPRILRLEQENEYHRRESDSRICREVNSFNCMSNGFGLN